MFRKWLNLSEATDQQVRDVIDSLYPNAHLDQSRYNLSGQIEVGDRTIHIIYRKVTNTVEIMFFNTDSVGMYSQSKELRPGSLTFAKEIKQLATALGNIGVNISYSTEGNSDGNRRNGAYSRYFDKQGWEPSTDGMSMFWKPPGKSA